MRAPLKLPPGTIRKPMGVKLRCFILAGGRISACTRGGPSRGTKSDPRYLTSAEAKNLTALA